MLHPDSEVTGGELSKPCGVSSILESVYMQEELEVCKNSKHSPCR